MKKILVVVDMQKDFIDGSLGTPEAVEIVDKVCDKIYNFDGDIIVTYDTHFENYLSTAEGRKLPVEHCIEGTAGYELDTKVKAALQGKSFVKVKKLTFGASFLADTVREIAKEQDFSLELVGLCTDICVVSNALILKANFPEVAISVDSACCAGVTPDSHAAALTTMRMCQIDVI